MLEPIFEADFKTCSYGFRPKRRAQDAIAEIHFLGTPTRNYEWIFEGDIKACFDEIDHTALMGKMRRRIGDKGILRLVMAFPPLAGHVVMQLVALPHDSSSPTQSAKDSQGSCATWWRCSV